MAGEKPKKRHIRWPCQRRWDPLRASWPARRPRCHGFEPQELVLVTKKLKASAEREYWKLICDQFQIIWKTLAFSSCVNNTRLGNYLFSSCQKCIFTHSHPLVLDKVALHLLGILAGQGGHGGKGSHPEILDLEAFQVFEDPRNRVWVQSGMTPIHAGATV